MKEMPVARRPVRGNELPCTLSPGGGESWLCFNEQCGVQMTSERGQRPGQQGPELPSGCPDVWGRRGGEGMLEGETPWALGAQGFGVGGSP